MPQTTRKESAKRRPSRARTWQFLPIAEAAALLGLTKAQVLEKIKSGELDLSGFDLSSSPVSESDAVSFDDGVKSTGKNAAAIERLVSSGKVRVRVRQQRTSAGR